MKGYINLTVSGSSELSKREIHQCQCPECQQAGNSEVKELHAQMNQFLSRLNEQQRRWYAALEAKKLGHGGTKRISQITIVRWWQRQDRPQFARSKSR